MFRSGQQIGVYTLVRQIGRGGFGEVWLADKRTQFVTKKVAIKLPLDEQIDFDAIRQEATLWEQASGHPNILPIIDADIYDGQVLIVSEYAEGGSLFEQLKHHGKLPLLAALEVTIGILSGLEFLHSRRIIHRDIKPQNILLQGRTPRLADFGISRAMNTSSVSATISGTDAYMAPEAFDGKRTVQTDIWSVGVVLYQLLNGSLPFPQNHPTERMFAVLTKDYEPLPADIPDQLKEIVRRSLTKSPAGRYGAAGEMREALERILIGIKHSAFAPNNVLGNPPAIDQRINDKSIQTGQPVFSPPPTKMAELPDNFSVATQFADKRINQPETLRPTEYSGLPPTVQAANPQFQPVNPQFQGGPVEPVYRLPEMPKKAKLKFNRAFYILPPLFDVMIIRPATFIVSLILSRKVLGSADFGLAAKRQIYFEIPLEVVVYSLLGAALGYFYPQGKWGWGILLNLSAVFVFGLPVPAQSSFFTLYAATTVFACLSSLVAGNLSPRES